jgi:hypothetical protein
MPGPSAASRPELLHRDHVRHELIDGDLGALVKSLTLCLSRGPLHSGGAP